MNFLDPQTKAIISAGLLRPVDGVLAAILVCEAFTSLNWWVFSKPTAEQIIAVLLSTILLCLLWLVVIVFRLGVIMLKMRADVVLMPNHAARIAEQMRTGMAKPPVQPTAP